MLKHNKKRNTAFLYEILVREIVKQTISKNKDKRDQVINVMKEHFKNNTCMKEELTLFKNILETKNLAPNTAEKLIQETKRQYNKIDKDKLFLEQSDLIKTINKNLSKGVFNNFVPNYKDLATLSQIFNDDLSSKKRVLLEENIVNRLITENQKNKIKDSSKISGLVIKKFVENYNKEYNGKLIAEQKTLLNKYILSFMDNGVDFKVYLNEEIARLQEEVSSSFNIDEVKNDEAMKNKMTEISQLLNETNKQPIDLKLIQQIVKIQNLVKEIQS
tara:strand:+ start:494 stop:1315 length:822 start_codon:yes stop_codon:yes gene_type:complete